MTFPMSAILDTQEIRPAIRRQWLYNYDANGAHTLNRLSRISDKAAIAFGHFCQAIYADPSRADRGWHRADLAAAGVALASNGVQPVRANHLAIDHP